MPQSIIRALLTTLATLLAVHVGVAADLPPVKYTEWSTEKDIFVPMRDGIHLDTDVWLPKGATGKLPTVLVRTPYDKDRMEGQVSLGWTEFFVKQGYAVVVQNERGRYFSEGYFKNYLQGASTDGFDTVAWVVKQPWSNGKVGTTGCSSSAETQWPMAAGNAPGHAAMIPAHSGDAVGNVPGNDTRGRFYRGGVPVLTWSSWFGVQAPSERLLLPPASTQEQRIRLRNSYSLMPKPGLDGERIPTVEHLPSKDILREAGGALAPFDNYITWSPADPRWNEVEHIGSGAKPRVPALHLDTWQDLSVAETTHLFKYVQDSGTPDQYLIIGAGPHCAEMSADAPAFQSLWATADLLSKSGVSDLRVDDVVKLSDQHDLAHLKFGDLNIGDARYQGRDRGYARLFLDWFDYWLGGQQNHVTEMPKVQLFVMGKGWISGDQWPLEQTRFTKYFLGKAMLSTSLPHGNEQDSYLYDPGFPTPSGGTSPYEASTPVDQRPTEARRDVLVYSTAPLDTPVTIAGPIEVVLYISSSAKDTDFMVKLVDVYPDGKAINLSEDAFRVRYREGFNKKVLMQPGEVYKITLPNMVTAIRFAKGHRVRLDVSSSSFPFLERNLNTGGNNYDETRWVVAENSIHHGPRYPSHIVLPVLVN